MKVLTFSTKFPQGHPRHTEQTYFVEKIWNGFRRDEYSRMANPLYPFWENYDQAFPCTGNAKENIHQHQPKHHTIRAGSRFKPGDIVSLRVWSDKPYRSKQIEFAQVEVKKVWSIEIVISHTWWSFRINDKFYCGNVETIANNDGLELQDFIDWFTIHPKSIDREFKGQIICWDNSIEY